MRLPAILATLGVFWAAHASGDVFVDWRVSCQSDDVCQLSQTLNTADEVWMATIGLQKADGAILSVHVPQGAHFPSGIYAKLPGVMPTRLSWLNCSRKACLAAARVGDPVLNSMRKNREGWLLYRPAPDAQPIEIAFSLMGVSAGLDALEEARQ